MNPDKLEKMGYWIKERESIRMKKGAGEHKPWTDDWILKQYKFCNVRREDDRVTQWFANNWRHDKYWDERNFVPAIIFGRTINWPGTLDDIGFPHSWEPSRVMEIMDFRQARGWKVYTGAYMITAGPTGVRKNEWVVGNAESYFTNPPKLDPTSIQRSWEAIMAAKFPCVGPFIAGQVIADLKQTKILEDAEDWWIWAAIGPGSMRGLNRLHDRKITTPLSQSHALEEMRAVRRELELTDKLCLQDVQNCLCEFDKYMRVLSGEGAPRSHYDGG
jgi:hypothetical protein